MSAFELSKWFLDCVTDSGDASIAYTGTVRWGPVCIHYSSLLESSNGLVRTAHSLRAQEEPGLDGATLRWNSDALETRGEWRADSKEIRETVFAAGGGSVEWRCVMPRSRARMNGREGLGYAEHLSMTIAPWQLPLRTLRWGRFLTSSEWIVWIDWQGAFSRRLVYRNGRQAPTALLEDDKIEFDDGARLSLDRSVVLREGPLGATALSVIPGVRDTFPARLLQMNECKWRSRGKFESPGLATVEGWALHERVDWPA